MAGIVSQGKWAKFETMSCTDGSSLIWYNQLPLFHRARLSMILAL